MTIPATIAEYLSRFSTELGDRILRVYPALQAPNDPVSERFETLLRRPFASQRLAAMGIVKRWQRAKAAAVVAECGTGKTLMALSAIHVHSGGRPYAALVMAPPNIVGKWCREVLITIPGARVFLVDGLRTPGGSSVPNGVNEVRYRKGGIVREGLQTSLTELRLTGTRNQPVRAGRKYARVLRSGSWAGIKQNYRFFGSTPTRWRGRAHTSGPW
jgi:hypothetical protein